MAKILVIDDDQDLSETVKSLLEYEGYEVLLSHDGMGGIETATNESPDLILMDVMMPGMDGGQAVRLLRKSPVLKSTPVVFLTGLVDRADKHLKEEGLNIEGDFYPTLGKPFENEKLLQTIKKNLA